MRKIVLYLFFYLFHTTLVAQQTFPYNGVSNNKHIFYAFTNAKIFVDHEIIIENGILLIKEGLIVGIGENLELPKGTVIFDLKGKFIYPYLIDAYTNYGMP